MTLSSDLVSKFVKMTKDDAEKNTDVTVYGTVHKIDGNNFVQFDGADILTPAVSTAVVNDGERVTVLIKNHMAVITGNFTSPAARSDDVADLGDTVGEQGSNINTINSAFKMEGDEIKGLSEAVTESLVADETFVEHSMALAEEVSVPTLRISSSRGTVFKNNSISTVLTVSIYKGENKIEDISSLRSIIGPTAHLQWYWQRLDDDEFGIISSSDEMLSKDGFELTISADDVDTKVTFMCELIT